MSKRYLFLLCLVGLGFLTSAWLRQVKNKLNQTKTNYSTGSTATYQNNFPKLKGVSWVAGDSVTEAQLVRLKQNNIEWISQTPFGWQTAYNLPEIKINTKPSRAYWGESDAGLIYTTRAAKKLNLKTLLKPHIWLRDRSGKWLGDIEMANETEWQEWFRNYRAFMLHYARLAEQEKMEALCIGTELHKPAVSHEQNWRALIKEIRQVYSGKLTYAANWYLEYEQIKFWDALDFIGVQAYFPLSKQNNPTLKQLNKAWQEHLPELKKLAGRYRKPIVFTEVGYKSTADAAIEPWSWPKHDETNESNDSAETQARCYQALFESVWHQPWFHGMFIWKWYPQVRDNGRDHRDFTPQHKPAEKILTTWFGKQ